MKTLYTFFNENKIAEKYQLNINELKKRYWVWLQKQGVKWYMHYSHTAVRGFVASPDGLNSSMNSEDYTKLESALNPTGQEFYMEMK